jgi:predicted RNase H-like HicB family nuclease
MKAQDHYLKFVRWEEADSLYVGYCPDLFPWGGVCHGKTEEEAYRALCEEIQQRWNTNGASAQSSGKVPAP